MFQIWKLTLEAPPSILSSCCVFSSLGERGLGVSWAERASSVFFSTFLLRASPTHTHLYLGLFTTGAHKARSE